MIAILSNSGVEEIEATRQGEHRDSQETRSPTE